MKNNRIPPADIRKALREEVYWGCPVDGCGSPYLSHHHYKPSWSKCHEHKVDGMIALCLPHHNEADAGVYTEKQLDEMKKNPFLKKVTKNPIGRFNFTRQNLVLLTGGNLFINPDSPIIYDNKVIAHIFSRNRQSPYIDMVILNSNNQVIFQLIENDWVIRTNISDLICPPSNKNLKLRSESEKFNIEIKYADVQLDSLKENFTESQIEMILCELNNKHFDSSPYYKKLTTNLKPSEYENILNQLNQDEKRFFDSLRKDMPLSLLQVSFVMGSNPTIKFSSKSMSYDKNKVPFQWNLLVNSQIPIVLNLPYS